MINHGKTLTVTPKFLEQEQPPADGNDFQQKSDFVVSNTEKTRKEQSSFDQVSQGEDEEENDNGRNLS